MSIIGIIAGLIFFIIGTGFIIFGFKHFSKYSIIKDTPRSKIRSMAMGLVELHGSVLARETMLSPFSHIPCVYYKYEIKEYREYTDHDSDGDISTSSEWKTIATGSKRIPFYARDETGSVYVYPEGAEFNISLKRTYYQHRGTGVHFSIILRALKDNDEEGTKNADPDTWGLEPVEPSNGWTIKRVSVGDREYYEYYLEPDETLFLIGTAIPDQDAPDNVYVSKGENEPTFIISNEAEDNVISHFKWKGFIMLIAGSIVDLIGVIIAVLI